MHRAMLTHRRATAAIALASLAGGAHAGGLGFVGPEPQPEIETELDRSERLDILENGGTYHLFNPAPRDMRRPLAPEPHPYTTEPGRIQIQVDPVNFTYDSTDGKRTRAFESPVLFKLGILENVDLQIGADAFVWEEVEDKESGEKERSSAFGDLTLASKINLWGNDEGETAASLMPFVVLPTAGSDLGVSEVEGGLMFPTAFDPFIADGWDLEFTPWVAAIHDDERNRYEAEFGQLAVLTRELFGDLEGFVEFESIITTESGSKWEGVVGGGLTWEPLPDTVFEAGVGFGVTRAADDFNVFLTVVQRF